MSSLIHGRRRIFSAAKGLFKGPKAKETGYYVLVPEIGEDLPGKFPLLKEDNMLPEFNEITIEKCIAAVAKQTLEFESGMKSIAKKLEKKENINVFTDIFDNIEELEVPLQLTLGIAKTLFYGNDTSMPTDCYLNINSRTVSALVYKYYYRIIYDECLKAQQDTSNMTEEQKQMLYKYILEYKLTGQNMPKSKKDILANYMNLISTKQNEFKQKLQLATSQFKHKITDPLLMKGFPVDFLKTVAVDPTQYEVGPWIITLHPSIVKTFLEYCPDPLTRLHIWQANVLRCSVYGEQELQNSRVVDGISADRCSVAQVLGYKNFVEMNLSTKMVENAENLKDFLNTMLASAYPSQVQEINALRTFAHERGFEGELKQWDLNYWIRKQKRSLYNYDEEELTKYFPLIKVVTHTFHLMRKLFNVEFDERREVSRWNRNVVLFDVYDLERSSSEPVGSFYLDPFANNHEEQILKNTNSVVHIINRSDICGLKPISSFIMTLKPPKNDITEVRMSFPNVERFIGNIGQIMQQLLTKVTYSDLAGISHINWDARDVGLYVMANWAYDPELLKQMTCHSETGKPLDDEMIKKLIASKNHMSGYHLCSELYLCNFDIDLHSVSKSWDAIMKNAWKRHFVLPRDKKDSHVCSWTKIFLEQHGASYYSDLWSRMIAADVYSAVLEVKGNEKLEQKVWQRFKDTYLVLGGSVHAREVFRRFRGRDPNYTSFLKSLKLK